MSDLDDSILDDWCIAQERLKKEKYSFTIKNELKGKLQYVFPNADIKIPQIKIIGHSFGEVDFDYFEVIRSLFPNAQWTYYYHDTKALCETLNNINQFKREKGNIDMSYEQLSTINIINE